MPEERKKEKDLRLARLLGGLAGVAGAAPDMFQVPLVKLVDAGIRPYESPHVIRSLFWEDPDMWSKAVKLQQRLKAPAADLLVGPETLASPITWIEKKIHRLFGHSAESIRSARPYVMLDSPSVAGLAHEIGHTVRSPITSAAMLGDLRGLRLLGLGGGVLAGLSDDEKLQKAAPYISVAPHVPGLLEEARATMHGTRGIAALEGLGPAAKALGRLTPAFLTYVAAAMPALMAPYLAKAIKDYVANKSEKRAELKPPKATGKKILSARQHWAHPAPKPKPSKLGKPGRRPAPPPSKARFYRDIQSMLSGLGTRA